MSAIENREWELGTNGAPVLVTVGVISSMPRKELQYGVAREGVAMKQRMRLFAFLSHFEDASADVARKPSRKIFEVFIARSDNDVEVSGKGVRPYLKCPVAFQYPLWLYLHDAKIR